MIIKSLFLRETRIPRYLWQEDHSTFQKSIALTLAKSQIHGTGLSRLLPTSLMTILHQRHGHYQRRAADDKRAKIFFKLTKDIARAVKEKGPDPKQNAALEALRIRCRNAGMPKDNFLNAIKKALRGGNTELESNILIQAKGPGKSLLMIDAVTASSARTLAEIRRILKRNHSSIVEDNSLVYVFSHKGVVTIDSVTDAGQLSENEAEEIAVTIDAEDLLYDSDEDGSPVYHLICQPAELSIIETNLDESYNHINVLSAESQYLPTVLVDVDEEIELNKTLIRMLVEHPDVVAVYDNIKGYHTRTIKTFTT